MTFLRDASFGPIRLGMTVDEVVALVGEPDCSESRRRTNLTAIHYGRIELYFDHRQQKRLISIYTDHFHELDGGSAIQFEPWILRGQVSLSVVEEELRKLDIGFSHLQSVNADTAVIRTDAGVDLLFGMVAQYPGDWQGLYSIGVTSGLAENDSGRQISVTLSRDDYEVIRRLAVMKRVGISKLCSQWLAEKVQQLKVD